MPQAENNENYFPLQDILIAINALLSVEFAQP